MSEPSAVGQAALSLYRDAPLSIRAFTWGRLIVAPLERVALEAPPRGRVLDLGCGHGLFTNILALASQERELLGVDPSETKLAVARRSSRSLGNVSYIQGTIADVQEGSFQAICILDVLYLLPDAQKLDVLQRCRALLAPDGLLLLKTNDTRPPWKYALVRLEEELAVRLLRLTYGGEIHFRGVPQYLALLQEAGFEARVMQIDGVVPIPHRLFVCQPR